MSVRARMLAWLVLVILPSLAISWIIVGTVNTRLSEQVEAQLENTRRLEALRIESALDQHLMTAESLAMGPHVIDFTSGVADIRDGGARRTVGGIDGFPLIDPMADKPLTTLTNALQRKAAATDSEVVELQLIGPDGTIYGQTGDFTWDPYNPLLQDQVLDDATSRFGNAFRSPDGEARLGIVVPVLGPSGEVVGALLMETRLGPIVDLVGGHEGFAQTSEAHIAQRTPNGDAQFITLLRFDRDAAFDKIVPKETNLPINQSLDAPGGKVLHSPDYRAVDSILAIQTLETTEWGLVVKVDAAEALGPINQVTSLLVVAFLVTLFLAIMGWAFLLRPLAHRLRALSRAASRIAGGNYDSAIGDKSTDELGELSRTIDRLAAELDADIKIRTSAEDRLRHQASHDHLTNIYNRRFAAEQMRILSATAVTPWSVLFLDLDGFKSVNDSYSHAVGDEVLRIIAHRLSNAIDGDDFVARWGGDEFVLVLIDCDREGALEVAGRVSDLLCFPMSTSSGELAIGASVGIATDDAKQSLGELLLEADSTMYGQKTATRGALRRPTTIERSVDSALVERRTEVWYQPILSATTERIVGAEALVRLRSPEGALIAPKAFMPAIGDEQIGIKLDQRVTQVAVEAAAGWLANDLVDSNFYVSINIGGASARDPELTERLGLTLSAASLAPEMLVVEISETAGRLDPQLVSKLANAGIAVAIDDVGISHSNFDRLLQALPRVAKLDRRWLSDGKLNSPERLVLANLVETCRDLGFETVAEGVESAEHLQLVRELGVDYVQGFYFGEPAPKEEFERRWFAKQVTPEAHPAIASS